MASGDVAHLATRGTPRRTEAEQGTDVFERETKFARPADEAEYPHIPVAIDTPPAGGARRRGQHLDPLVITDRLDIDPGAL